MLSMAEFCAEVNRQLQRSIQPLSKAYQTIINNVPVLIQIASNHRLLTDGGLTIDLRQTSDDVICSEIRRS